MTTILIDNLHPRTDRQDIINICSDYGNLFAVHLYPGYAIITYEYFQDALDAMMDLDGQMLDGNILFVNFSN